MPETMRFEVELPRDLALFRLPEGVNRRLQELLDKQDAGTPLTDDERREAEGLAELNDLISLLRLRAERLTKQAV
jgi:hypothetical protein